MKDQIFGVLQKVGRSFMLPIAVLPVAVGSGCTVSPVSGEVVDLTSPRVYTVTNGTETNTYTVIVTLEKSVSQQLWEKVEDDSTVADHQVVKD